jgi:hypothetical protein
MEEQLCNEPLQGVAEILHIYLVLITPPPVFARLEALHQWMATALVVFQRVFVLRGFAAANVTACQADAKVDPLVADFQAFLAASTARRNVVDHIEVGAGCSHSQCPVCEAISGELSLSRLVSAEPINLFGRFAGLERVTMLKIRRR